MPVHTTLTAVQAGSAHALTAASVVQTAGMYPGATTYPSSSLYPGRGSNIVASQITPQALTAAAIT